MSAAKLVHHGCHWLYPCTLHYHPMGQLSSSGRDINARTLPCLACAHVPRTHDMYVIACRQKVWMGYARVITTPVNAEWVGSAWFMRMPLVVWALSSAEFCGLDCNPESTNGRSSIRSRTLCEHYQKKSALQAAPVSNRVCPNSNLRCVCHSATSQLGLCEERFSKRSFLTHSADIAFEPYAPLSVCMCMYSCVCMCA